MAKTVIYMRDLKPGLRNDSVHNLQWMLKAEVGLDFSSGPAIFGPLTKAAYATWQRKLGYTGSDADGIPGVASMVKLCDRYGFALSLEGYDEDAPSEDTGGGSRPSSPVPGYGVNYAYGIRNSRYAAGFHTGEDHAAPTGTPVVAVTSGVIAWANHNGGAYGTWIGLKSDNGHIYTYNHLSRLEVTAGQRVVAGQRIGRVGATGNVTGPHLHFEMSKGSSWSYGNVQKPTW